MPTNRNHQNNFATNLTSNTLAGATTTPLNSIPSIDAPFTLALDATNINGKYEIVEVTSKTATNVNHAATAYAHTTAEEVRMVIGADEMDEISEAINTTIPAGWISYSTVTPTRASADDPTYVLTFAGVDLTSTMGVGMKVKWTQNSTVRYGIITAIAFSTNTTLTLYGGTDYDVDDTGTYAISAFHYSTQKAPLSFPLDPTKWTVTTTDTSIRTQATPVQNTWYNPGSITISIPIGCWKTSYQTNFSASDNAASVLVYGTLSTANNSESDVDFTCGSYSSHVGSTSTQFETSSYREKYISLASKTAYYLNVRTTIASVDNIYIDGATGKTIIRAVCAYL